jgi:hypothetical protein
MFDSSIIPPHTENACWTGIGIQRILFVYDFQSLNLRFPKPNIRFAAHPWDSTACQLNIDPISITRQSALAWMSKK